MRNTLAALFLLFAALAAQGFGTNRPATPSTFASVFAAAQSGDVILLAPGNYGNFSGGTKSGMVTIQPDSSTGGTQSNVIFGSLNLGASQNITFSGMTIGGGTIGVSGGSPGLHIHILNSTFTSGLCIHTPKDVNQDTLIDGNTFGNIGQSCTEGRLGVTGDNVGHSVVNGVVISNNTFTGPGGSGSGADGIQINGGAYGTYIGPGNTFKGILESGCGAVHCDAIQFYGASHTTITGNFFYNNSDAIMSPDCNGSPMTVTNNVFVKDPSSAANEIMIGGGNGDIFAHNTFGNSSSDIRFGNPNGCGLSSNVKVTNNILQGGINLTEGQSSSAISQSYNLGGSVSGTGSIVGSPTYVGGSSPTTLAGFNLSSSSLGINKASDGTNMGAPIGTLVGSSLAAPSGLTVTVR